MTINNRGLSGQPTLPYADYRSYAGQDIWIDLAFLDYTGTPVLPTSLVYRIDDLTNATPVIPITTVAVTGMTQTVHIPGAQLQMTHYWQGSEIFQIWFSAILPGGPVVQSVSVLELLAIQTPNNAGI